MRMFVRAGPEGVIVTQVMWSKRPFEKSIGGASLYRPPPVVAKV